MEDLVPFLIFLVIVGINVVKFFAERGKSKKPAQQPSDAPAKQPVSSLEKFFASLAEQVEPKPTELPDWPERQEMAPLEPKAEQTAEIIPMSKLAPAILERDFQRLETPVAVQPPMRATNAILSGSQGMRMPSHNTAAGHPDFRIAGKKNLKQAILAHVVFSPPRAYDLSFDNTIAK
jgi:hypothetical protein